MTEAEIKAFAQEHAPTLAAPIAALCAKVIEKGLRGKGEERRFEPKGEPTAFSAGFSLACEEIAHRIEHEEWVFEMPARAALAQAQKERT